MAAKEIRFHRNAREKILRGADTLANAVRVTLGPRGRNVLIEKSWGASLSTIPGEVHSSHDETRTDHRIWLRGPRFTEGDAVIRSASALAEITFPASC
jgi:hypothetical protein